MPSALGLVGYNASGADRAQQARPVTEGPCLVKKEKVENRHKGRLTLFRLLPHLPEG